MRRRWWLLGLALLMLGAAAPLATRLSFDRRIETLFDPDDPVLLSYQRLKQTFGGNAVVLLVYRDDELATGEGMERNETLTERVGGIAGVGGVLSPAVLNDVVAKMRPGSLLSDQPALFRKKDAIAGGFNAMFSGYTHSRDRTHAAVVAMLEPARLAAGGDNDPIDEIRRVAKRFESELAAAGASEPAVLIAGEPVLVDEGFDLIARDGRRLAWLTLGLLGAVVLLSLASIRFTVLAVAGIVWADVVTRGIVWLAGINLSLVSTVLTAIVTVIAVAAVLHLGVAHRRFRARGASPRSSTRRGLAVLAAPIAWTCATDAAGFLALSISRIAPVRQFGVMMAIASAAVLAGLVLIGPAVMSVGGSRTRPAPDGIVAAISRRLKRGCRTLARHSVRFRWAVVAAAASFGLVALSSVAGMKSETNFLNNFRPGSSLVRTYAAIETHLGGAGVWDVLLPAPQTLTKDYLKEVRRLESRLRAIDVDGARLTKVISLADADVVASRNLLLRFLPPEKRLEIMRKTIPTFFGALLTPPEDSAGGTEAPANRQLRIMLRAPEDLDADGKNALIDAVRETVDQFDAPEIAGEDESVAVTGYYVLMTQLVSSVVADGWRCFFAAGLLVWLLLWVATGSFRLASIAMIPNFLPVLLVLAAIASGGRPVNMGAAMIAAVSIGLTIDGSVHFLFNFQTRRRRGHAAARAAVAAAGSVGLPILMATAALVIGFAAMSSSEFIPTATFGTLVAATLGLGFVINLSVLPAMVTIVESD